MFLAQLKSFALGLNWRPLEHDLSAGYQWAKRVRENKEKAALLSFGDCNILIQFYSFILSRSNILGKCLCFEKVPMYYERCDDISLFGGKSGLAWVAILNLGSLFGFWAVPYFKQTEIGVPDL